MATLLLAMVLFPQGEGPFPSARVKSIVISPFTILDQGKGVEVFIQIEFLEPAFENGSGELKFVQFGEVTGAAFWEEQVSSERFFFAKGQSIVTWRTRLHVLQTGSVTIQAEIPFDYEKWGNYYSISLELKDP